MYELSRVFRSSRSLNVQSNRSFWVIVALAVVFVLVLWVLTPNVVMRLYPEFDKSGQLADLFGTINALFSGLAFAGVITAILLQRQELQLQRQELTYTREELKRTADAQTRQVSDTRILQRAYVTVEPDGVHALVRRSGSGASVAHVEIVNSGNLPAYNVAWGIVCQFGSDHDREDFVPPKADGSVILPPKGRMIQGGGRIHLPTDLPMSPAEMLTAEKVTFLFVWGRVTYTDGFGVPRVTDFCHRYNCQNATREGPGIGYSIPRQTARHHRHGNSAD